MVCYIQKYVIILARIFPLTSPPTKILGGCVPGIPGGVDASGCGYHDYCASSSTCHSSVRRRHLLYYAHKPDAQRINIKWRQRRNATTRCPRHFLRSGPLKLITKNSRTVGGPLPPVDAAATPSLRHRVAGVAVGPAVAGAGTRHLPPSPDTCPTVVLGEGRVCEGANVGVCQSVTSTAAAAAVMVCGICLYLHSSVLQPVGGAATCITLQAMVVCWKSC